MAIPEQEWLARCAKQYETRGGLVPEQAMDAAKVARQEDRDGDFTDTPEEAADEDMACWTDDGE